MNYDRLLVKPGTKVSLQDYDSKHAGDYKDKTEAAGKLQQQVERLAVADIICSRVADLDLEYPTLSEAQQQELAKAKEILENEG